MTDTNIPEDVNILASSSEDDEDTISELDELLRNAEASLPTSDTTTVATVADTLGDKIIAAFDGPSITEDATPQPAGVTVANMGKATKADRTAASISEVKPVEKEKELTPLEKMKLQQQNKVIGQTVSNEALAEDAAPLRDFVHNDERMEDIDETLKELDNSIEKRNAVVIKRQPQNGLEFAQAMLEIDCVKFDSLGKAYIDLKDAQGHDLEPVYIRIRKDDEDLFDYNDLDQKFRNKDEEEVDPDSPEGKKKKTIEVLIDKTGLGSDFMFTPEEKLKLAEAERILITSTSTLDISSIKAAPSDKAFQDVVNTSDLSSTRTTICFPASGFKADMTGMGYGEYADVAIDVDNGFSFDKYRKRLTVIYNKMRNISCGPFKDFETFLKGFAYTDISMAIYGLYLSTEPEEQSLQLRCGNPGCENSFDWYFRAHSLLRLNKCADKFLEKMHEITTAPASNYDDIRRNSEVLNPRYIKLPMSNFIVEVGIASAYDFLYNFVPLLDQDTFEESFPDMEYEDSLDKLSLLTVVRSIRIPDGDDKYIECYGYKDILGAIERIHPKEIKILLAYMAKLQSQYQITFSFGDVTCPHCGNVSHDMNVTIDELVFRTYQQLTNIEIDLENTLNF